MTFPMIRTNILASKVDPHLDPRQRDVPAAPLAVSFAVEVSSSRIDPIDWIIEPILP
jgi:hypothetical protein